MKYVEELTDSEFVHAMKALGYGVEISMNAKGGDHGIIVAMAKEIESLKAEIIATNNSGKD